MSIQDLFERASDEEKAGSRGRPANVALERRNAPLRKNSAMVALALIILLFLFAFIGTAVFSPYDYDQFNPGEDMTRISASIRNGSIWQRPIGAQYVWSANIALDQLFCRGVSDIRHRFALWIDQRFCRRKNG
ncbi:MAG: hypothetical protein R2881_03845 [Eubacteriales bacterium]